MTNSLVPEVNPLTEADPKSLDQLLSEAPEKLSREEKVKIIEALRVQRKNWRQEEMAGKVGARKSSAAKTPKIAASPTLSIDDLGL